MNKKLNAAKGAFNKIIEMNVENFVLGLGTGSTTDLFTKNFLPKLKNRIDLIYSSSARTTELVESLGIKVEKTLPNTKCIDIYVDGADEIDPELNLIKGGGGAHLLEKKLTKYSKYFICIADNSKQVHMLGKFGIPVEACEIKIDKVITSLNDDFPQIIRRDSLSDSGNILLDLRGMLVANPLELEKKINAIDGILEVGIFAENKPNTVIIGHDNHYELIESRIA